MKTWPPWRACPMHLPRTRRVACLPRRLAVMDSSFLPPLIMTRQVLLQRTPSTGRWNLRPPPLWSIRIPTFGPRGKPHRARTPPLISIMWPVSKVPMCAWSTLLTPPTRNLTSLVGLPIGQTAHPVVVCGTGCWLPPLEPPSVIPPC